MELIELGALGAFIIACLAVLSHVPNVVAVTKKFCKRRWCLLRVRWFNHCEKQAVYSLEGVIGKVQINEIGASVDWSGIGNVQYHHVSLTLPRALAIPLEWAWVQEQIDLAQIRTSRRWLLFKHREVIGSVDGVATSYGVGVSLYSDKVEVSLSGAGLFAVWDGRRQRLGTPEVYIDWAESKWAQWHQDQQTEWEARQS